MERISKSRLFSLFSRERLHRFKIEIEVKMQVVQILAMNEKIEHVVALTTHLKTSLHPVQLSELEEFSRCKRLQKRSLTLRFRPFVMQLVQNPPFQQFLITHPYFDRVALGAPLFEPVRHERNVVCSSHSSTSFVEGRRGVKKRDAILRVFRFNRLFFQKSLFRELRHLEIIEVLRLLFAQILKLLGLVG